MLQAPTPAQALLTLPDSVWDSGPSHDLEAQLEAGHVLHLPELAFPLDADELRFLDPRWSDGKSKNISLRENGRIAGAVGDERDLQQLQRLVGRYATQSRQLVERMFPHYRGHLRAGNASLRPFRVEGRPSSWRRDDSRLHVDAFPSNPTQGLRLLRVFHNLNPNGVPRRWRIGEPFDDFARNFAPRLRAPLPGSARLLQMLGVTKSLRSRYDDTMLQLHDLAKADLDYQRNAPQVTVDIPAGSSWIVFSDQVLHAVMGGQHMMEQTFYLEPRYLLDPNSSPLRRLETLLGQPLL